MVSDTLARAFQDIIPRESGAKDKYRGRGSLAVPHEPGPRWQWVAECPGCQGETPWVRAGSANLALGASCATNRVGGIKKTLKNEGALKVHLKITEREGASSPSRHRGI